MDEGGPFKLEEGPSKVDGKWEAVFVKAGRRMYRYLTEDQTTNLLRLTQAGKWEFSLEEIDDLTTPPDYRELERREKEGG